MLETIQCDICGRDYTIDDKLFSPYGTEHITIRLENFISSSARAIRYNTCPECTRKVLGYVERMKGERNEKETKYFNGNGDVASDIVNRL